MAKTISLSLLAKLLDDGITDSNNYLAKIAETLSAETWTEQSCGEIAIAASQTDQAIAFGGVTNAKIVILVGDDAFQVKVTGAATPNLIPCSNMILLTGDSTNTITAISVTTGAAPVAGVNIKYFIAG